MEGKENFVLLDSSEDEEIFLKGKSSTPAGSRRLSAASRAAILKSKNLIPPLHSPTDRRLSLRSYEATKLKTPDREEMPQAEKRKPRQSEAPVPTEQGSSENESATTTDNFIREQLAALTAMITTVRTDIGQAEAKTVQKIDNKVDDLATKL